MAKYLDQNGLSTLSALIKNAAVKIATGSYVGTGLSGSSNPNSLTFDFAPKMIFMLGAGHTDTLQRYVYDQYFGKSTSGIFVIPTAIITTEYKFEKGFCSTTTPSYSYCKKSDDGKTIYWYYNNDSAASQMNLETRTYHYLAIS